MSSLSSAIHFVFKVNVIHSFSPSFFSFCLISLAHVLVSDLTIVVPVSSTPMIFFVSLRENVFFPYFWVLGFFRYL